MNNYPVITSNELLTSIGGIIGEGRGKQDEDWI